MLEEHARLLKSLRDIWSDAFPVERPRRHTLLEKLAASVLIPLRLVSFGNFIRAAKSDETRHLGMDLYVPGWAIALTAILLVAERFPAVAIAAATYRIVEIAAYRAYFLLIKSQERPWEPVALRRSVIVVLVNLYEVMVAYAALYATVGSLRESFETYSPKWVQALYFSVATAMTIGYGDVAPGDATTRLIVIAQAMTTGLLVIIVIPALVSIFSSSS